MLYSPFESYGQDYAGSTSEGVLRDTGRHETYM
jgi:hypothetical protein